MIRRSNQAFTTATGACSGSLMCDVRSLDRAKGKVSIATASVARTAETKR